MSDKIVVCDHYPNPIPRQPAGEIVGTYVQGLANCTSEMGPAYADFNALEWVWSTAQPDPRYERIGFFGRRKYILFQPAYDYDRTPWGPLGWYDASRQHFDEYRNWLANWNGAELKPLLAKHDILVTPPWKVEDVILDFADSRSRTDAASLDHALYKAKINTFSTNIYPYIFITRWSVFNRFMKFAVPFAKNLEPWCKGVDSKNEAYKKRPMAYVMERAFSLWLESADLDMKVMPILNCWDM